MRRQIAKQWWLDLDKGFRHRIEGDTLMLCKRGRTVYARAYAHPYAMDRQRAFDYWTSVAHLDPLQRWWPEPDDLLRYAYLLKERHQRRERFALYGITVSHTETVLIVCYFDNGAHDDWAAATWLSVSQQPVQTASADAQSQSLRLTIKDFCRPYPPAVPPLRPGAGDPPPDRYRQAVLLSHRRDNGFDNPGDWRMDPVIDRSHLVRPMLQAVTYRPHFRFREVPQFQTSGEPVLITDPIYLADVYNSADPIASYVREQGVILDDFGGDLTCAVWWRSPYLILLLSEHPEECDPPDDVTILSPMIGCDSGSFVFLPLSTNVPEKVKAAIEPVVAEGHGVVVPLMKGIWTAWYEPGLKARRHARKIVLAWQPDEEDQPGLPLWE